MLHVTDGETEARGSPAQCHMANEWEPGLSGCSLGAASSRLGGHGQKEGSGLSQPRCCLHRAQSGCRHFMVKLLDDGSCTIPGQELAHASLDALVAFHQQQPLRPHGELLTQPCGQVRAHPGLQPPRGAEPSPPPPGSTCSQSPPKAPVSLSLPWSLPLVPVPLQLTFITTAHVPG